MTREKVDKATAYIVEYFTGHGALVQVRRSKSTNANYIALDDTLGGTIRVADYPQSSHRHFSCNIQEGAEWKTTGFLDMRHVTSPFNRILEALEIVREGREKKIARLGWDVYVQMAQQGRTAPNYIKFWKDAEYM